MNSIDTKLINLPIFQVQTHQILRHKCLITYSKSNSSYLWCLVRGTIRSRDGSNRRNGASATFARPQLTTETQTSVWKVKETVQDEKGRGMSTKTLKSNSKYNNHLKRSSDDRPCLPKVKYIYRHKNLRWAFYRNVRTKWGSSIRFSEISHSQ